MFLLLDEQTFTTRDPSENKTESHFNLCSVAWHSHSARLFCGQQKRHGSHCRQGEFGHLINDGRLQACKSMLAADSKIKLPCV